MKFFYYELKLWSKDIAVVFWALFFPLILVFILNSIYGNLSFSGTKIGVPPNSKFQNEHTVVVNDYREALKNDKIDMYVGYDVVLKKYIFGSNRFIEEMNYRVQGGKTDYTNSNTLSASDGNSNNLFFSMVTMQVLYSMFVSVLLFDKYAKDKGIGARISLSPSSDLLLKIKTFITTLVIINISIGLMITYLITQTKFLKSISLVQIGYLEILAVIAILVGYIISNIPKLKAESKQGVAVSIAQTLTFLSGGFGLYMLQYVIFEKAPMLKYISPALLVNRLATYKFDLESLVILFVMIFVLLIVSSRIGGKK
jgi:membrane protein